MKFQLPFFTLLLLLLNNFSFAFATTTTTLVGNTTSIKIPLEAVESTMQVGIKPIAMPIQKSTSSRLVTPISEIDNLPEISTSTLSTIAHQEIKRVVSKLDSITEENKNLHLNNSLHLTVMSVYNSLASASLKTEILIGKLDTLLLKKQAVRTDMSNIISKENEAKISLNTANRSLSTLSILVESFISENSTSTYKKLAQTKKIEFHLAAESARKNIKSANETIKQALAEMRQNLAPEENSNVTSSSSIKQIIVPLSPSSEVLQSNTQ